MNRKQFKNNLENIFKDCLKIVDRKNSDYSTESDPFQNFRIVEKLDLTSVEKGILVRMIDKVVRVSNLIDKEPKVLDEKIEDTLKDLINYSAILLSFLQKE